MTTLATTLLVLAGAFVSAAPTPASNGIAGLQERDLTSDLTDDIDSTLSSILSELNNVTSLADASSLLVQVTATATPTAVPEALASLSSIFAASPTPDNIIVAVAEIVAAGLTDSVEQLLEYVEGLLDGESSETNDNPLNPTPAAYPQAGPSDAPYSLSEAALREAIYIPSTFQYGADGAPQPIILVPGTGDTGYTTFVGNYIPLLTNSTIADPVWLNIPGFLLGDAQVNAEYVAYAINYIYGISNQRPVAVAAWSQGNINAQWAYKYWPSTIPHVTDHIGFSADYHGTVLADLIALGEPLPPSLLQQEYTSNFITTLRADDGDSAYVPTTSVYSGFLDEIVEPQQGTDASAYILDARNVGVSNNEVQLVCPGTLAGSLFTHEGTMYNALGYALLVDALSNDGPGEASRLDLTTVCDSYLSPGLDLGDFLLTENTLLVALLAILTYPDGTSVEPAIMAYAA